MNKNKRIITNRDLYFLLEGELLRLFRDTNNIQNILLVNPNHKHDKLHTGSSVVALDLFDVLNTLLDLSDKLITNNLPPHLDAESSNG